MKQLIIFGLLLALLGGCKKADESLDSGTITGTDPRDCMCCGGWFIEIKDTVRRFDLVPADCTIDFSTVTYPLQVKVEWKKKDITCLGDEILVTLLKLEK
ncbi:MAG: hypothetical protein WC699_02385 [Bacteroidales bacterium]|jgi:hypothetical protein